MYHYLLINLRLHAVSYLLVLNHRQDNHVESFQVPAKHRKTSIFLHDGTTVTGQVRDAVTTLDCTLDVMVAVKVSQCERLDINIQTDIQRNVQMDKHTDRHKEKHTQRQTNRQTKKQTKRQTSQWVSEPAHELQA